MVFWHGRMLFEWITAGSLASRQITEIDVTYVDNWLWMRK
jgi:hypothetical protein